MNFLDDYKYDKVNEIMSMVGGIAHFYWCVWSLNIGFSSSLQ